MVQHEHTDCRGLIARPALALDCRNDCCARSASNVRDFLERIPKGTFKADAGIASVDRDVSFDNRRFAASPFRWRNSLHSGKLMAAPAGRQLTKRYRPAHSPCASLDADASPGRARVRTKAGRILPGVVFRWGLRPICARLLGRDSGQARKGGSLRKGCYVGDRHRSLKRVFPPRCLVLWRFPEVHPKTDLQG